MTDALRPRRSVLYMPGANQRALEKARELPCDGVIFDLEDAVAADAKADARANVAAALEQGGYGYREVVVRVNALDTPWGREDVAAVAALPADALLFPKVQSTRQIDEIVAALDAAGGQDKPVWIMVETPRAVLDVAALASHSERVAVLVMGTSDLVKELRARHTPTRHNLAYALQHCVLAARDSGRDLLDGVHLEFRDLDSFRQACEQARDMGFDGKTLIHPSRHRHAAMCGVRLPPRRGGRSRPPCSGCLAGGNRGGQRGGGARRPARGKPARCGGAAGAGIRRRAGPAYSVAHRFNRPLCGPPA
ncbi:MAG: CoA ester lyase [Gammaproteobacteria bacterium]|nr:CoA ester lyase [Gammaproteobacteria bacterium]